MTTIAWRDGVLAADKKASDGGTAYKVTKLFRTKTHAIAVAGDFGVGQRFVEWFKHGADGPEESCPLNKHTSAFVMDLETGKCVVWEKTGPIRLEDKFAAIGTGADLAMGAMSFGASAIEAVECASEWDNYSGLGVNHAKCRRRRKGQ